MVFQCMWSLCLGILDAYALLLKRSLRNSLLVSLFVVGDWVRSSYLQFSWELQDVKFLIIYIKIIL